MLFVVCCMFHVVRCWLLDVGASVVSCFCWMLLIEYCVLCVACCVCRVLCVVCCVSVVVVVVCCWLVLGYWLSFVVYCVVFIWWCFLFRLCCCLLHLVCFCCLLFVEC